MNDDTLTRHAWIPAERSRNESKEYEIRPYTKDEDSMLWELHEIRRELHKEISQKTVEQINHDALIKFRQWQQQVSLERKRHETAFAAGLRGEVPQG